MFAIIEIGGKQYKVAEKEMIRAEKVEGSSLKVLLVADGTKTHLGKPYLPGAKVELELVKTGKDPKVISFKMKAKKRYKRLKGHRQQFNEFKVGKITV